MIQKALFLVLCSCFFSVFSQHSADSSTTIEIDSIEFKKPNAKKVFTIKNKLRVGFGLGVSRRFGSLDQLPSHTHFYYNDLKSGGYYQLNVDYGGFNKLNVGVTYGQHSAQKLLPNQTFVDSLNNVTTGNLSDAIRIRQLLVRISSKKYLGNSENVVVWTSLGAGVAFYSQQSERGDGLSFSYLGNSWVIGVSTGIDVFISKHVALGAEANFVYGSLSKATYDDGLVSVEVVFGETEKINLSKLEFGIGCRYYF